MSGSILFVTLLTSHPSYTTGALCFSTGSFAHPTHSFDTLQRLDTQTVYDNSSVSAPEATAGKSDRKTLLTTHRYTL